MAGFPHGDSVASVCLGLPGGSGGKSACKCGRCRFSSWFGKIPRRRKQQPIPVFLPEKPMDRGPWWVVVHGVTTSRTRLSGYTGDQGTYRVRHRPGKCARLRGPVMPALRFRKAELESLRPRSASCRRKPASPALGAAEPACPHRVQAGRGDGSRTEVGQVPPVLVTLTAFPVAAGSCVSSKVPDVWRECPSSSERCQ